MIAHVHRYCARCGECTECDAVCWCQLQAQWVLDDQLERRGAELQRRERAERQERSDGALY